MTDHSFDSGPYPDTRVPDARDALMRVAQMLDFLISTRSDAEADCHPGETWVLGAIADGIREARLLLEPAAVGGAS